MSFNNEIDMSLLGLGVDIIFRFKMFLKNFMFRSGTWSEEVDHYECDLEGRIFTPGTSFLVVPLAAMM